MPQNSEKTKGKMQVAGMVLIPMMMLKMMKITSLASRDPREPFPHDGDCSNLLGMARVRGKGGGKKDCK